MSKAAERVAGDGSGVPLDRTAVFHDDADLHDRVETIFGRLMATPPPPAGPPRDELLARMGIGTAA
jgi:hypothetical protein